MGKAAPPPSQASRQQHPSPARPTHARMLGSPSRPSRGMIPSNASPQHSVVLPVGAHGRKGLLASLLRLCAENRRAEVTSWHHNVVAIIIHH